MNEEKNREQRLRRKAKQQGYSIVKSRIAASIDNHGEHSGYRIVNSDNFVERGEQFDLSLDDVEDFLNQ
jgi:hypothetical protein